MNFDNSDFSFWYSESSLIGLLKNLHRVNIEDYNDVTCAIFSFEKTGKRLFMMLSDKNTLLDGAHYNTIEIIYLHIAFWYCKIIKNECYSF